MFKSAEIVRDNNGKQYHIGLTSKDISDRIILVGSPERAKIISGFFSRLTVNKSNRDFAAYTGYYKDKLMTVMATGMGAANTEIAVVEMCGIKFPITVIRCGTCGSLQKNINLGDIVISQGSVRLENTTSCFVESGYPAVSSYEISVALIKSAAEHNFKFHYGITATSSGFYGGQCRKIPGFPLKDEELIKRLIKQGVKNFEMETSALLTLATLRGFRAGAVCAVVAERQNNKFINPKMLAETELKAIKTALKAFELLDKMDNEKGKNNYWFPKS